MKNYLSFGGGVNSIALYLLMQDIGMDFEAVFVDHGCDWPETYEYTKYFITTGRPITVLKPKYYIKKEDRTYDNLFEYSWEKRMVPSIFNRWCTNRFKIAPMNQYVQKPCFVHIGFAADESHRAKISSIKGIEHRWLLIEHDINRQGCIDLIEAAGLKTPMKSGCFFCPFQRAGEWRKLRRKHPALFCKAQKLEKRNMEGQKLKGKRVFALRSDGKTLDGLINDKQRGLPGMKDIEYPPCQCEL